tara:strand:- start:12 stop:425 length:414 start_codon:yes stop_codon:yes gene_type:complete
MWILNDPSYGPPKYVEEYRRKYKDDDENKKDELISDTVEKANNERNSETGEAKEAGEGREAGETEGTTTEENIVKSICSYCRRGDKAFSSVQLRHDGIWLHSFRYSMNDGGQRSFSYQTELPSWCPQDLTLGDSEPK